MTTPVIADLLLEGDRIALRPVEPADIDAAFAALHGHPEVLDWLIWSGPEQRSDLEPYYGSWRRPARVDPDRGAPGRAPDSGARDYALAIVDLEDGAFCGSIGLRSAAHPGLGDLGYWVATERWGRGFASEAIRLITWLGFGTLRLDLIYANVFLGNQASRRALEKSGYTVDREAALEVDGAPRDQWCLGVTQRAFLRAVGAWGPATARIELSDESR